MSASIVDSLRGEYRRYKALAEAAIAQLADDQIAAAAPANSIAVIVWHVSGNLASRFTDFLTSDGEKPWRNRDEEFVARTVSRAELLEKWEKGWRALYGALDQLTDADLGKTVTIRQQPMLVHEALHRSLAHTASHVGQIVYIAKTLRAGDWRYLSIPPGQSQAYNQAPAFEKPDAHSKKLGASS
ncbi:MAG: DUF1572 family protein [Acidobacteriota bacterium]